MGCDFVGEVVALGDEVPQFEVSQEAGKFDPTNVVLGQLRWGMIRGGVVSPSTGALKGAFAEYVTVPWDLTGLVPKNITPEQAAGIPIPFATVVRCLLYI